MADIELRTLTSAPEPVLAAHVATKNYVDTTRNAVDINTRTASYGPVLSDANRVVEMNSTSATTFTVPTNANIAFPLGTSVYVTRLGTGAVTINAASGVTINGVGVTSNSLTVAAQYSTVWLRKRATDAWILVAF